MSAAISLATGRVYGVERVCRVWELSRSSYYSQLSEAAPRDGQCWAAWSQAQGV